MQQPPPPPPPPQITGVTVAPQSVAMAAGATTQFSATVTGDATNSVTWSVNGVAGGKSTTGTIDASGNYTAPQGTGVAVTITATSTKDTTKSGNASAKSVAPGTYAATNNTQVVQYTVTAPADAKVSVEFGLDTNYGTPTWQQATPAGGGAVSLFVAGMKANTTYHMRGVVAFNDGSIFKDADHTFATGAPVGQPPMITVTTTPGTTPQSGVEFLNVSVGSPNMSVAVTDLGGNILWAYMPGAGLASSVNPFKLLPNGHMLMNFSGLPVDGTNSVLQEVDLGGNLIWQMTAADLNNALAAATCPGCNITVVGTHHDFVLLPNGHLVVLASTQQTISGTTVTGDALIDLDENHKPVWVWNEFVSMGAFLSRQPFQYPDWMHSNAVIYSKDDGNLIVSMRHQNWLVKVDYENGSGDGHVLWKLGFQGDFTLYDAQGGIDNDQTHWFFAQHGPSFTTTNTTGNFGLTLFDNGDDRGYPVTAPAAGSCGVTGQPACFSTVPVLQLDDQAMTAKLAFSASAPAYSFFGGNAAVLSNGNLEYCESATAPSNSADIYEISQTEPPQSVWHMHLNQFTYRGFRMPSLYPGVQW